MKSRPVIIKTNENTDADGNRGTWVTYVTCPKCGDDLEIWHDCECGEEIDWETED